MGLICLTFITLATLSIYYNCVAVRVTGYSEELHIDFISAQYITNEIYKDILSAIIKIKIIIIKDGNLILKITPNVIGYGGNGFVLLGFIELLDTKKIRPVAVKVMQIFHRFDSLQEEFDAYGRLGAHDETGTKESNACVAQAYKFKDNIIIDFNGESLHLHAIFMQLLGKSLATEMQKKKFDVNGMHSIVPDLVDCLAHFHAHEMIVNDLKPGNIVLSYNLDISEAAFFIVDLGAITTLYLDTFWRPSTLIYCSESIVDYVIGNWDDSSNELTNKLETKEIYDYFNLLIIFIECLEQTNVRSWYPHAEHNTVYAMAVFVKEARQKISMNAQCIKDTSRGLSRMLEFLEKVPKTDNPIMCPKTIKEFFKSIPRQSPKINFNNYQYNWIKKETFTTTNSIPYVLSYEYFTQNLLPDSLVPLHDTIFNFSKQKVSIEGKYMILPHIINHGTTSLTFLAQTLDKRKFVVIKMRQIRPKRKSRLKNQYDMFEKLRSVCHDAGTKFIPKAYCYVPEIQMQSNEGIMKVEALVMELLGPSLETFMNEFRFSLEAISSIYKEALEFLNFVHQQGINVNELSPAKILIDLNGEGLKFTGFGNSSGQNEEFWGEFGQLSYAPGKIINKIKNTHETKGIIKVNSERRDDYVWLSFNLIAFMLKGWPDKWRANNLKLNSTKNITALHIFQNRSKMLSKKWKNDMTGTIQSFYDKVNGEKLELLYIGNIFDKNVISIDCKRWYFWMKSIPRYPFFEPYNAPGRAQSLP